MVEYVREPYESQTREEFPTMPIPPNTFDIILKRAEIVEDLGHLLKGEVKTSSGAWVQKGLRLLNDEGIKVILTTVQSFTGIDKLVTDIAEDDIRMRCKQLRHAVSDLIRINWRTWEMDKDKAELILEIVDNHIFANFTASAEGTMLNFMKPTLRRIETFKPEEKGRGWKSYLPFFGEKSEK